jgi:penicillin-binding protein 2A
MVNAGYIDQATADAGFQVDLASQLADTYTGKQDNYSYPSYFDAVIAEAIDRYGLKESDIINNGYRIYTEMDQNSQASMQVIFNDKTMFPTSSYDGTSAQAASVALDPTTGGVRALVGRVNSSEDAVFRTFNFDSTSASQFNIKPLVAYAPAVARVGQLIHLWITIQKPIGIIPYNDDYSTSDTIPMYQALALSYNLPVAYIVNTLGIDKAFEFGQKFGLDMENVEKVLGASIGSGVKRTLANGSGL